MRAALVIAVVLAAVAGAVLLVVVLSGDDEFDRTDAEAFIRDAQERFRPRARITDLHCQRAAGGWSCRYRTNGKACVTHLEGDPPEGAYVC